MKAMVGSLNSKKRNIPRQAIVLICITAGLLVLGSAINNQFLAPMNIANILTMSALLGFVSIGQTLVVLSGDDGLDLSVGGVMSLGAVMAYMLMNGKDENFVLALVVVLGAGALFGFLNAVGIVFARIPALVMTLAMANVLTSVQQLYSGGNPTGAPSPVAAQVATSKALPFLPWIAVLWVGVIILVYFLLTRTSYGKQLYATGANKNAALLAGVRVKKIRIITYTLCGVLSAFAGFWLCSYVGVIYVNAGTSYVMPSVAAVVIGGTLLSGGKGSYNGTVVGAIILTIVDSLLVMLDTDEAGRFIMNGVILVVLLAIYTRSPKIRQ
ncbi:MAG: ABC transporter permease [Christensenella sp.]|uniref:ABC transporter permease n=1 Tax=Christensenella sp. TaxID=1935934 RepID=UPI002B1FF854|nr:ABC transporter permease [Christensenella sp.]MEA5002579.1 ABC transporter permease [Christensenella sp.]